jgi:DNA recombination protein RmuC|tara:strand:- start:34086 stop:35135 length:1050 start_codon:yes stop_codon:yes gene_type:complete
METMLVVIIGLLVGVIITHLFQNTIKKDNNNNITADDFNSMKSAIEEIKGLAVDSKEDRLITKGQVQEQYTQVMSVIKEQEKTTTKLTTALTGSNKQQGNWGEVILKNLLSNAGFQEGRDYTSQVKYDSPDGENKQQPDVIINLPENRQIIIDSKVSLKDWYEFMNAENEDSRKEALKKHIASMQRHIKQLASTDYQKLYQINTIDVIVLFTPIESAFHSFSEKGEEIIEEASRKKIIIVSPSTLFGVLKIIENMWSVQKRNEKADHIARVASEIYDQVGLVYDAFEKAHNELGKYSKHLELAKNRLKDGKGSLISKANKMREIGGLQTKKILPEIVENNDNDDKAEIN